MQKKIQEKYPSVPCIYLTWKQVEDGQIPEELNQYIGKIRTFLIGHGLPDFKYLIQHLNKTGDEVSPQDVTEKLSPYYVGSREEKISVLGCHAAASESQLENTFVYCLARFFYLTLCKKQNNIDLTVTVSGRTKLVFLPKLLHTSVTMDKNKLSAYKKIATLSRRDELSFEEGEKIKKNFFWDHQKTGCKINCIFTKNGAHITDAYSTKPYVLPIIAPLTTLTHMFINDLMAYRVTRALLKEIGYNNYSFLFKKIPLGPKGRDKLSAIDKVILALVTNEPIQKLSGLEIDALKQGDLKSLMNIYKEEGAWPESLQKELEGNIFTRIFNKR